MASKEERQPISINTTHPAALELQLKEQEQVDTTATEKTAEAQAVESLREGVCAGAGPFLAYTAVCCLLVLVTPLVLVFGIESATGESGDGLSGVDIVAICSLSIGLLLCLWGIAPALVPPPKPPPTHGPYQAVAEQGGDGGEPAVHVIVKKIHLVRAAAAATSLGVMLFRA